MHRVGLLAVGRYLGVVGSLLILSSFAYSLRKRRIVELGTPRHLLTAHELLSWIGALMILVHGGIHFNAFLPWLALLAMLIVVASGLTGKYLLQEARESVYAKRATGLREAGLQPVEVERETAHPLAAGRHHEELAQGPHAADHGVRRPGDHPHRRHAPAVAVVR